jgi:hypothetical protein
MLEGKIIWRNMDFFDFCWFFIFAQFTSYYKSNETFKDFIVLILSDWYDLIRATFISGWTRLALRFYRSSLPHNLNNPKNSITQKIVLAQVHSKSPIIFLNPLRFRFLGPVLHDSLKHHLEWVLPKWSHLLCNQNFASILYV